MPLASSGRGSRTTLRRRRQRDYVTSNIVSRREEFLNASYRVRLAAIEIDPFVGTEIQAGIIKADLDTTFQAMKP